MENISEILQKNALFFGNPVIEDFTTYTEHDNANNRITFTGTNKITHRTQRDDVVRTYTTDDKGVGHFGDFEHLIDIETDFEDSLCIGGTWAVSNYLGGRGEHITADEHFLLVFFYRSGPSVYEIRISSFDGTTTLSDNWVSAVANTRYYCTVERASTTLTCKIYSDSARTNLLDTLTVTCVSTTFRYIYAGMNHYTNSAGRDCTNILENWDLQEGVPPSNSAPMQSGNIPHNDSTNIVLTPDLFVMCSDLDGNTMNATWYCNATGGDWDSFATNTSIANNTNITQTCSPATGYSTKYWWAVNLTDGKGGYHNVSYDFTTTASPTWNTVNSTINGTYSNSTSWYTVNNSINGTYSNTTVWYTVNNIINGTYSNVTQWYIENNAINGTYSSVTSWEIVINTIDGTYSNSTLWYLANDTINGSYSNATIWFLVNNTINGSYSNTSAWYIINNTINGTYSNTTVTAWNLVNNTINGTYSNSTLWITENNTINGTYSNTTNWYTIINTINGSYSNTTAWYLINNTINGSYSNTTGWFIVNNSINGTYSNTTVTAWNLVNNTINGTYSNTSIPSDIIISSITPTNNTVINYLYPSVIFTINSTQGKTMNYTIYWNTSNNITLLFITNNNITNNTFYHSYDNVSQRGIRYYWRINANDGTININTTYSFTTGYEPPYLSQPDTSGALWIVGILVAIVSIILLLWFRKDKEEY